MAWGLDRVFITGVSPVVLGDMTSGYNVAKHIDLDAEFNDLCGFTEAEVGVVLEQLAAEMAAPIDAPADAPTDAPTEASTTATSERDATAWSSSQALATMRTFYNGYRFSEEANESLYNPTLSLYFLDALRRHGKYPHRMLDENLAMDRNKLSYIAALPGGQRSRRSWMRPPRRRATMAQRCASVLDCTRCTPSRWWRWASSAWFGGGCDRWRAQPQYKLLSILAR